MKEGYIEKDGVVTEALPGLTFAVNVDGHRLDAHLSGKLRMNFIRVAVGDRVKVEISVYDLTKCRIIWRYK